MGGIPPPCRGKVGKNQSTRSKTTVPWVKCGPSTWITKWYPLLVFIFSLKRFWNVKLFIIIFTLCRYPSTRTWLRGNQSCYTSAQTYVYQSLNICPLINTIYLCIFMSILCPLLIYFWVQLRFLKSLKLLSHFALVTA